MVNHYLDNAATTAVRAEAIDAMLPLLSETYANPSGSHSMARMANRVLDESRDTMAELLGAKPGQIIFTSGGTEADNLAITGVAQATGKTVICSAVEHHAVLEPTAAAGGRVIGVHPNGQLNLDQLSATLEELKGDVGLVSVMAANNETGIIQPIEQVVDIVKATAPDALIHTDAIQAVCWMDVAQLAADVDLISVSGHKFGAPKGVGVLVARDGAIFAPQALGGGQERDRRGGTQNVPGIGAMAAAAKAVGRERPAAVHRVRHLRDKLRDQILGSVADAYETGEGVAPDQRTAGMCHLCFQGVENESLLFLLEQAGVMASAASSCASGATDPSHVLAAMGVPRSLAAGSLRLSLGYTSTEADVDAAAEAVIAAVSKIRSRS